jgi:hypothetical protein
MKFRIFNNLKLSNEMFMLKHKVEYIILLEESLLDCLLWHKKKCCTLWAMYLGSLTYS